MVCFKSGAGRGNGWARALAILAGSAVGLSGENALAQPQTFSFWVGPPNGVWSNPVHWNNFVVPSIPGHVFLLQGGTAQLNMNIVVDKFGLEGGTLNINNNQVLGVRTRSDVNPPENGLFGGGTINMNSAGNATYIRLYLHDANAVNPYAIHGVADGNTDLNMSNTIANIIDGNATGITFSNGGRISGSGQIGTNVLKLDNQAVGVIRSTHVGGNLIIDAADGGMTNAGVLRAAGGTLTIQNSTVTQTGSATIDVSGATPCIVNIANSTIIGGRIATSLLPAGTHYVQLTTGSVLDNVSVDGTVRVPNNNVAHIRNGITGTGGDVYLDSAGNSTYLRALNNATLNGQGGIICSNTQANIIDASVGGLELTNNLAEGIRGSAQIGANALRVVNNTFIESVGTQGMRIDPPASGFVNNGIVRSTPNSPMLLTSGTFENALGTFESRHPSTFSITAATIVGGVFVGEQPSGVFSCGAGSVFGGITIAPGTIFGIPNNNVSHVASTLTNRGLVTLNSIGNGTYLRTINGDVTLTGGGLVTMSNTQANVIEASMANQRLTNVDNTIRGSAQICANSLQFVNADAGVIEAQGNQGIQIDPPGVFGFENDGMVRALAGSFVNVTSGSFDNTQGEMEAMDGGTIFLAASTITGGVLRSFGTGSFNSNTNNILANVTLDAGSVLGVPNANLSYFQGTITNRGTMRLNSIGNGTYLRTLGGNVTLDGGGVIEMSNTLANIIDASVANQRLTNVDNTIRGSASICANSLQFVNNHVIEALGNQGIQIDPPGTFGFENNGVVRALPGSFVNITSGSFDNADGVLEATSGGTVFLSASTITGGVLRSFGTGSFNSNTNNILANVTLDAGSVLGVPNANLSHLQGTITNRGTMRLNSIGNGTYFRTINGDVTLAGGGVIELSNTLANIFDASIGNQRLTNENNSIRGSAQIGANSLSFTNRGSIVAIGNQGISIDAPGSGSFRNDTSGLLRAETGNITIQPGPFSTAGTVIADAGRLIQRTSDSWAQTGGLVLANGEIQVDNDQYLLQGGTLGGTGRVDSNVINSGGTLNAGASPGALIIEGTYAQQVGGAMLVEINGILPSQYDRVTVTGAATLGGTLNVAHNFTPDAGQTFDVLVAASLTGTFANVNAPGYVVEYLSDRVRLTFQGFACDSIDFNNDGGSFDPQDIDAFLSVFSEGPCVPETATCGDIDFNNDGSLFDPCDIASFLTSFAEGPCTPCGV
jgi:hypothetical protein